MSRREKLRGFIDGFHQNKAANREIEIRYLCQAEPSPMTKGDKKRVMENIDKFFKRRSRQEALV